jgi:hypothetical protein
MRHIVTKIWQILRQCSRSGRCAHPASRAKVIKKQPQKWELHEALVSMVFNNPLVYRSAWGPSINYTGSDWALVLPSPPLSQLQGWPGWQKIKKKITINMFRFCTKIEPKLNKLRKNIKIEKKNHQKSLFSYVFLNSIQFGFGGG